MRSGSCACRPEADLINAEGFRVRLPVRGRKVRSRLDSRKLPGQGHGRRHRRRRSVRYDLVGLAMQEPQYRSPGVRELLDAVGEVASALHVDHEHAAAAYLRRIPGLDTEALQAGLYRRRVFGTTSTPACITLCSPDPQAIRPPDEKVNVLQVTLPTNFKVARFPIRTSDTAILRQLQDEIEAIRFDTPEGKIELPVKLKVYDSIFVPLAKWAMLLRRQLSLRDQGRHAHRPGGRA